MRFFGGVSLRKGGVSGVRLPDVTLWVTKLAPVRPADVIRVVR